LISRTSNNNAIASTVHLIEAFAISIPVNSITFEIKIASNDLEQFLLDKVCRLYTNGFSKYFFELQEEQLLDDPKPIYDLNLVGSS
jgi:hypothetical protein